MVQYEAPRRSQPIVTASTKYKVNAQSYIEPNRFQRFAQPQRSYSSFKVKPPEIPFNVNSNEPDSRFSTIKNGKRNRSPLESANPRISEVKSNRKLHQRISPKKIDVRFNNDSSQVPNKKVEQSFYTEEFDNLDLP